MRTVALILLFAGCSPKERIEVAIPGDRAERLLRFYFGSYVPEDPFRTGVLEKSNERFYVDLAALRGYAPEFTAELEAGVSRSSISSEHLQAAVQSTYYDARKFPKTLPEFNNGWSADTSRTFEVHGPVTRYLRRITIMEGALQDAIMSYYANGERLYYRTGTVIRAEHVLGDRVVETTAMVKRSDGFWDFVTYDSTGYLTSETRANPRTLATPAQCAGCHLGKKAFEPEQSWPIDAPPAPEGIRKWYSGARDIEVAEFFREHALRSDMVLGIYATAYVSDLRMQRGSGMPDSSAMTLLDYLGL